MNEPTTKAVAKQVADGITDAAAIAQHHNTYSPEQRVQFAVRDWQEMRAELLDMYVDLDEQTLSDTLEGEVDLHERLTDVAKVIGELEAGKKGLQAYIAEVRERQDRFARRAETLRNLIVFAMGKAKLKTVPAPECTITVRTLPGEIVIDDETKVPKKFWRKPDPVIDRTAINAAIKAKEKIAGVSQGEERSSLTIRRK